MSNGAADTIYTGNIITMDDVQPKAEAVAVKDGKILAVGSRIAVNEHAGPATATVDLGGKTMLPGFLDGHSHFINAVRMAKWANVSAPPVGGVRTIAGVIATLQKKKDELGLKPGEWLMAYGYDSTAMEEHRILGRDDLDPAFPDNPILILHVSLHGAILNTAGFKAVHFDLNAPTPPGGMTLRKEGSTEAAGLVMEHSFLPIFMNMPAPSEQEQLESFAAAQRTYASSGYTTAQDAPMEPPTRPLYHKAAQQGRLFMDVVGYVNWMEFAKLVGDESEPFKGAYADRFRIGGVKLIGDGSPQGKTAFWTKPLLTGGPSGEQDWRGQPNVTLEDLKAVVKLAYDNGIQLMVHCTGDATIDMVLEAHEAAGAPKGKRTVIIHSTFVRADQLDKYAEYGILVSFFTNHTFFWGDVHVQNLGEERAYFLCPAQSARAKGISFSNHSDFAVTPLNPMFILWTSVNRVSRSGKIIGESERISAAEGLRALTIDAAYQYGEEATKGSIVPGKLADFAILDADPTAVDPAAIKDVKVVETIKEGKTIYNASA